jgi:hypothetical protein
MYSYSNNKLSEVSYYSPNGTGGSLEKKFVEKYFYSKDAKLDFMESKDIRTNKLPIKYLFTTNAKSQITKITRVDPYPVLYFTIDTTYTEYEYDNVGNLILSTYKARLSPNGEIETLYKKTYEYDNKRNPYQGIQTYFRGDINLYVSPNNLIRKVYYNWPSGKPMNEEVYEYEYNSEGMPVKETMKRILEGGSESSYILEASIEYY